MGIIRHSILRSVLKKLQRLWRRRHRKALEFLGIDPQHYVQWQFNDLGLDPGRDRIPILKKMVQLIRTFKPVTVITMDPKNMENEENADHRLVAITGFEAAALAAYPNVFKDQFKKTGVSQHFVSRLLFYMPPEPNLFVNIEGKPLEMKIGMGLQYPSQLKLMVEEIDKRLRNMDLDPEILDMTPEDLWRMVCEFMAEETAKYAAVYYQQHPEQMPDHLPEAADAFRLYFLGAVEKLREYLPDECLRF